MKKAGDLIRLLSIGKYSSKLYHRGQAFHSTLLSGIFTIVSVLTVTVFACQILVSVFRKEEILLSEKSEDFGSSEFLKITYAEAFKMKFKLPAMNTLTAEHRKANMECSDLKVDIYLKSNAEEIYDAGELIYTGAPFFY